MFRKIVRTESSIANRPSAISLSTISPLRNGTNKLLANVRDLFQLWEGQEAGSALDGVNCAKNAG